jgi:nucleoid DNA-binding protein
MANKQYKRISMSDLANEVALSENISLNQSKEIIRTIFNTIKYVVYNEYRIAIPHFGTFYPRHRKATFFQGKFGSVWCNEKNDMSFKTAEMVRKHLRLIGPGKDEIQVDNRSRN